MSYSQIVHILPGGFPQEGEILKNSFGTCPVIWEQLGKKYISPNFHFFHEETIKKLWDLWKDPIIPLPYRAVLLITFDRAYVVQDDFQKLAGDIDIFLRDFPKDPAKVNHWPRIAEILRSSKSVGIGLYGSSAGENPFDAPWEDQEEREVYNFSQCFDIYKELEGLNK